MIWNAFTSQFCKIYIALSNHKECVDWNDWISTKRSLYNY